MLILTTQQITPTGCTFYDVTYTDEGDNGPYWPETSNMSWNVNKWIFHSTTGGHLDSDHNFNSYRPQSIRITYTNTPNTHDWRFTVKDRNFQNIADSGNIIDPGPGQFIITMPLTFLSNHINHDIEILLFSWPAYTSTGSIDKIEFCSIEPPPIPSPTED